MKAEKKQTKAYKRPTFSSYCNKATRLVRSSTLFTFGYPTLMLSLMLQYISFYYNINIATFVGFQIAVYAYVVLRILLHTQAQVARVNA